MSRTTHKYIKLFPTYTRPQVNTEWYRTRRKQFRAKNKCLLRYLLANYPVDININTELPMISDLKAKTVNDLIYNIKPRTKFDCYNEPSDGRFIIYYKDKYKKDSTYHYVKSFSEFKRKIYPKLRKYNH